MSVGGGATARFFSLLIRTANGAGQSTGDNVLQMIDQVDLDVIYTLKRDCIAI